MRWRFCSLDAQDQSTGGILLNSGRTLLFLVAEFFAAVLLTGISIGFARRLRLLAHPVERSSHDIPTPQVGGVGICLTMLAAWIVFPALFFSQGWNLRLIPMAISFFPGAIYIPLVILGLALGLIDDVLHLSAVNKLVGLIIVASVPALTYLPFFRPSIDYFPFLEYILPFSEFLGLIITIAWILFFMNAFNFMDGTNGQAGVFAIHAIVWWVLMTQYEIFATADFPEINWPFVAFMLVPVMATLGFLVWNFPRAWTFMGDSGSLPLGGILALMAVVRGGKGLDNFVAFLFPLSVFIFDVLFTLVRRKRRGENILQAHRSHLYQRMLVARGWSHGRLLAFHLPYYIASGILGFAYFVVFHLHSKIPAPPFIGRTFFLILLALLLHNYARRVILAEKQQENIEGKVAS